MSRLQNGQSPKASIHGWRIIGKKQKDPLTGLLLLKDKWRSITTQKQGENARARPCRAAGLGPGSDTFGRGDVAEADLGRLIPVLIGAFVAAAGSPGGRPAPGGHVLGHGELRWVCVGLRKDGWTRITAGGEVRERAQRLHEPSRMQRLEEGGGGSGGGGDGAGGLPGGAALA